MTQLDCMNALNADDLRGKPQGVYAPGSSPGTVTGTYPGTSALATPGRQITVYVSDILLPDCTGIGWADCKSELLANGLSVSMESSVSSAQTPGTVAYNSPAKSSLLPPGFSVIMYVSGVQIPGCTGLLTDSCQRSLTSAGLKYVVRYLPKTDPNLPGDYVEYTAPNAATWVPVGTTVTEYCNYQPS